MVALQRPTRLYEPSAQAEDVVHRTDNPTNTGSPDNTVDAYDPVFFIAVDPQGRRIATYRGSDTYPKETFVYHPREARGLHFQGGVLLRDRSSSLATTPSTWASAAGNATRDERMYYASDYRGNVIAMIKTDDTIAEQYRYSSSGVPFGLPAGSVKGDGVVDGGTSGADYLIVDDLITNSLYAQRADLNLDGVVDSADLAIVTANNGKIVGRGKLSTSTVSNRLGPFGQDTFGTGGHVLAFSRGGIIVDTFLGIAIVSVMRDVNTDPNRVIPLPIGNPKPSPISIEPGTISPGTSPTIVPIPHCSPTVGIIACLSCCEAASRTQGLPWTLACVDNCYANAVTPPVVTPPEVLPPNCPNGQHWSSALSACVPDDPLFPMPFPGSERYWCRYLTIVWIPPHPPAGGTTIHEAGGPTMSRATPLACSEAKGVLSRKGPGPCRNLSTITRGHSLPRHTIPCPPPPAAPARSPQVRQGGWHDDS